MPRVINGCGGENLAESKATTSIENLSAFTSATLNTGGDIRLSPNKDWDTGKRPGEWSHPGQDDGPSLPLEIQQQEYPTIYTKFLLIHSKSGICVLPKSQPLHHLGKHNHF